MTNSVRDNPELHRFELDLGDSVAVANYRETPGVITIFHTETPSQHQGQGVASTLVTGALDIIRSRGQKVRARCAFVTAFLAKHPEYQDLIG